MNQYVTLDYTRIKKIINNINLMSDQRHFNFSSEITVLMLYKSKIIKNGCMIEWQGTTYFLEHIKDFFIDIVPKEQLYESGFLSEPTDYYKTFAKALLSGQQIIDNYKENVSFIEIGTPFAPKPVLILDNNEDYREANELLQLITNLKVKKINEEKKLLIAITEFEMQDLSNSLSNLEKHKSEPNKV